MRLRRRFIIGPTAVRSSSFFLGTDSAGLASGDRSSTVTGSGSTRTLLQSKVAIKIKRMYWSLIKHLNRTGALEDGWIYLVVLPFLVLTPASVSTAASSNKIFSFMANKERNIIKKVFITFLKNPCSGLAVILSYTTALLNAGL